MYEYDLYILCVSSMAIVAHDRMSEEEIVSNIVAAASQLAEKLPGGEANIRNLHIKCSSTTAVPLYVDFGMMIDFLDFFFSPFLCLRRNFRRHITVAPSVCLLAYITYRVSAIT